MAVLIRIRSEGMTPSLYDQMAPPLVEKLKTQAGFLLHASYEAADGVFAVAEIWESREQHDAWFEQNVRPSLPGAVEQEVIPLHSLHEAVTRAAPHAQGLHSIHPA
jgi:quinol monooxygenase YgiN